MKKAVFCFCVMGLLAIFSAPSAGLAQEDPAADVQSLNQKAMSDYQNMKIPEAMETLQEAEITCLQFGLLGHEIALTYMNMGVIEAAGNQDETAAMDYFTRSLCIDSSMNLDPLVSTPEVEAVFSNAKEKAGNPANCNQSMLGGLEPPPPADEGAAGFSGPGAGPLVPPPPPEGYTGPVPQSDNVRHDPVTQQAKMTPVPIYIMVRPGTPVDKVILFYRTYGEHAYQQFLMAPMGEGYGVSIGCDVLQTFDPSAIEYYIGVMDATGMAVGFAGNEGQPFSVSFVDTLSGPAPSFPNTSPPEKCVSECPPWNPDCNAGSCKQYGDLCDRNSDCCKGMICVEQTCTPGDSDGDDKDSGPFTPHFRMGITFGTGGGYIPTDYAVPSNRVASPPSEIWTSVPANQTNCLSWGYGFNELDKCYEEKVKGLEIQGGIAWSKLHFRLSPTLYITEKLMVGLVFRGGLTLATSGDTMAVAPLGLVTVGYRVLGNGTDLVDLTVIAGLGGGVMYHKLTYPDCNPVVSGDGHPWANYDTDGLVCDADQLNNVTHEWLGPSTDAEGLPNYYDQTYFRKAGYFVGELGLDLNLWVIRNFGVNIGIAVDFLAAPNFAINGDVQAGVAMRF